MFRVCAGVIIHTQMLRLVFIALQSEVRTKSKALISLRKWEATIRLTHNREKGEMAETIKSSIVAANAAVKLVSELRKLIPTFQLYSHAGQLRNHMYMGCNYPPHTQQGKRGNDGDHKVIDCCSQCCGQVGQRIEKADPNISTIQSCRSTQESYVHVSWVAINQEHHPE